MAGCLWHIATSADFLSEELVFFFFEGGGGFAIIKSMQQATAYCYQNLAEAEILAESEPLSEEYWADLDRKGLGALKLRSPRLAVQKAKQPNTRYAKGALTPSCTSALAVLTTCTLMMDNTVTDPSYLLVHVSALVAATQGQAR